MTVAGFVNAGDSRYGDLNAQISIYMISFLSKLSRDVTPYFFVEKAADENGFWNSKKMNIKLALAIADNFSSKYCLTGTYSVDSSRKTTITMIIIDLPSGTPVLEKTYRGTAEKDIFLTVDKMIKDSIFVMFRGVVEMEKLAVSIETNLPPYRLFLNGNAISEIAPGRGYENDFVVGQFVNVTLKTTEASPRGGGKEVYNANHRVEKGKPVFISYAPSGRLIIKTGIPNRDVYMNGRSAGITGSDGNLILDGVRADQRMEIVVRGLDEVPVNRAVSLKEGEELKVVFINELEFLTISIEGGMFGALADTYVGIGVELEFWKQWRVEMIPGLVFYNQPEQGFGVIPFIRTAGAFMFTLDRSFRTGFSAGALFFFGRTVAINPILTLDAEWLKFTLSAGARYSFGPVGVGFYPVISAGFRF